MQVINDYILDLFTGDGLSGPVDGPFRHDDNVQALAGFPGPVQLLAQFLGPVNNRRKFGDEDKVCLRGNGSNLHKRKRDWLRPNFGEYLK